jgi:hypothetical protein
MARMKQVARTLTNAWTVLSSNAITSGIATAEPGHKPRNRETARWLSIGGVLASAAIAGVGAGMLEYGFLGNRGYDQSFARVRRTGEVLIGVGAGTTLFTPSIGEWYSGQAISTGMKLRMTGVGVGLLGAAIYAATGSSESCLMIDHASYCGGGSPPDVAAASVPVGIGVALYVSGIIYDLVDAPSAADRYNARHVEVLPTILPTPTGTLPGVALGGTF